MNYHKNLLSRKIFLPRTPHVAFTLVEMLVVIAILAILVSLLNSSLKNLLWDATNLVCQNSLKTIGQVSSSYQEDNYGHFPIAQNWDDQIGFDDLLSDYDGRKLTKSQKKDWYAPEVESSIYTCPFWNPQIYDNQFYYRSIRMSGGSETSNDSDSRGISSTSWSARDIDVTRPSNTIAYLDAEDDGSTFVGVFPLGYPIGAYQRKSHFNKLRALNYHRFNANSVMCDGGVKNFSYDELTKGSNARGTIWDMWK